MFSEPSSCHPGSPTLQVASVEPLAVSGAWPSKGALVFENVELKILGERYRMGISAVLLKVLQGSIYIYIICFPFYYSF